MSAVVPAVVLRLIKNSNLSTLPLRIVGESIMSSDGFSYQSKKMGKINFFFFPNVSWEGDLLTTDCCEDTSKVNEMRKARTDRWDNTQGRFKGPERRGTSFQGKREMTFQSPSGLMWRRDGELWNICFEEWPREEGGWERTAWKDGDLDNTNTENESSACV